MILVEPSLCCSRRIYFSVSAFIVKLRWSNDDLRGDAETSSKVDGQEDTNSVTTDTDHDMDLEVAALNCSDQGIVYFTNHVILL